jgi:hypothetical protein
VRSEAVPSVGDTVAGVPTIEDTVHDAPPSYAHVSNKRSRNSESSCQTQHRNIANALSLAHTNSTPNSPLVKHFFQDPTCARSPTERATSASSPGAGSQLRPLPLCKWMVSKISSLPPSRKCSWTCCVYDSPAFYKTFFRACLLAPHRRYLCRQQSLPARPRIRERPSSKQLLAPIPKPNLESIFTDALDRASELHNSTGIEFDDHLGDIKL